ncbi:MAG: hypothetical protein KF878_00185 [Planctomycetes bacterium]|nr:hypothetical protein [Planctomycetota bacterium]
MSDKQFDGAKPCRIHQDCLVTFRPFRRKPNTNELEFPKKGSVFVFHHPQS